MAGMMALIAGGQTGLAFGQDQANAQAASMRGRFQNSIAERNAQIDEMQRDDALNRGSTAELRARGDTSQGVSSSRAALAAQGIDVSSGSASAVTATQQLVGDLDALTIRDNAAREAWGYNVEAANQRLNGKLALIAGENEAAAARAQGVSTLIGGAASIYDLTSKMQVPKSNKTNTGTSGARVSPPATLLSGDTARGSIG